MCLAPLAPLASVASVCKKTLATCTQATTGTCGPVGTFAANGPVGIAFDGTNMWVSNCHDNTVTELSPDGGTLGTFPVGDCPNEIAFDGTNMWVVNNDDEDRHQTVANRRDPRHLPRGRRPRGDRVRWHEHVGR